jgi:hypothetical protein
VTVKLKEVEGSAGSKFVAVEGYIKVEYCDNGIWYFFDGDIIYNGYLSLEELLERHGLEL